jgi:GTPase SAR1 family protein
LKRNIIRKILLFLIVSAGLTCFTNTVISGDSDRNTSPVTATAEADRTTVSIGDKIKYTITVNAPEEYDVRFPDFGDNLKDFSIKDFGSSESGILSRTRSRWYVLDTYETGTFTIPQVTVQYREKDSEEWHDIVVDQIKVEVRSLLGDADNHAVIRDIRGPQSLTGPLYLYIALTVIIIGVVAALIILFIRKRKKVDEMIPPPRPAHEIAYEALTALKDRDLTGTGKVKEYYCELSDIVRRYLENRFSLKAPEMTTEEFLSHLRETDQLRPDHKGLLREFLSSCDLVKFAKYLPGKKEIESSFEYATKLVDQTKERLGGIDTA